MTDGDPPEERPLSEMSDGAVVQAIESLRNAKDRVEHAEGLMTGPIDDIAYPRAKAADASERIDGAVAALQWEASRRGDEP